MMEIETIFDSDREEYEYMQEKREQRMKEQIEEMCKLCPFYEEGKCNLLEDEAAECNFNCDMCDFAITLYNASYRKQSENTIELPCKIGDTVYIIDDSDYYYDEAYVLGVEVLQFFVNKNGLALDLKMPLGLRINTWAVVGKNVFLTEAEAEEALAKMKGGAE